MPLRYDTDSSQNPKRRSWIPRPDNSSTAAIVKDYHERQQQEHDANTQLAKELLEENKLDLDYYIKTGKVREKPPTPVPPEPVPEPPLDPAIEHAREVLLMNEKDIARYYKNIQEEDQEIAFRERMLQMEAQDQSFKAEEARREKAQNCPLEEIQLEPELPFPVFGLGLVRDKRNRQAVAAARRSISRGWMHRVIKERIHKLVNQNNQEVDLAIQRGYGQKRLVQLIKGRRFGDPGGRPRPLGVNTPAIRGMRN